MLNHHISNLTIKKFMHTYVHISIPTFSGIFSTHLQSCTSPEEFLCQFYIKEEEDIILYIYPNFNLEIWCKFWISNKLINNDRTSLEIRLVFFCFKCALPNHWTMTTFEYFSLQYFI